MTNNKLFIDFHVIQTVPPSCVNRDDTGSPKTAIYGGVTRSRVSSQCWKQAMRDFFRNNMEEAEIGKRTKYVLQLLSKAIMKRKTDLEQEQADELAQKILEKGGIKIKNGVTDALVFLSLKQIDSLAELVLNNENPNKKEIIAAINENPSVDIALFGRMVASNPLLDMDASAQVAHSISTHRVSNEYDYFTAIDDYSEKETAGAGMIGVIEYNSSTLYRYATVAVHDLCQNIGSDTQSTAEIMAQFAKAFILSMPTGKQNTFANRTLPDAILVTVRHDQPINLVGAFEDAIKNHKEGYVEQSVARLYKYAGELYANFGNAPANSWSVGLTSSAINTEKMTLPALLDQIKNQVLSDLSSM